MAIREVMQEELRNSLRMEKSYQAALARLPRGVLVKKLIRQRPYFYLLSRERGKVCFKYLGQVSAAQQQRYAAAKQKRAQYRRLLAQVRKQIRFLRKVAHGKSAI
jgi:hypothetical protein